MSAALSSPRRLALLEQTGLLDNPSSPSLDRLARIATDALDVPVALVSLVDDRRQFFASQCGLGEPWASRRETPLSHSFCLQVVLSAEALIVNDARHDPRVRDNPAIRELEVIAYAGIPLRIDEQSDALGSFCAIDARPRQWTDRELRILAGLAETASGEIALQRRARLAEKLDDELLEIIAGLESSYSQNLRAVRDVEHDLRTPLNTLSLSIEALRRHAEANSPVNMPELLRVLRRSVEHATSIAQNLSTSTTGAHRVVLVDFAALVRQACADTGSRAPQLSVELDCEDPLFVLANSTDIRRAVDNILDNARRFAQRRIAVRAELRSETVRFAAADDGPGLDCVQDYERAWERSTRFHRNDGRSRSGLGLSIVRAIVERHDGQVFGGPSQLGGATFGFALPVPPG